MQTPDFKPFVKILEAMAENYGKALSPALLDLYWASMHDWTLAEFQETAALLLKTHRWMPQVDAFQTARRTALLASSGEIFATLRQYLVYSPTGYSVRLDAPRAVALSIQAIGGADAYAMASPSQLPFLEKRFCQHYDDINETQAAREALPALALPSSPHLRLLA